MKISNVLVTGVLALCTAFPAIARDRDSDGEVISVTNPAILQVTKPLLTNPYQHFSQAEVNFAIDSVASVVGESGILMRGDAGIPVYYRGYSFSFVPFSSLEVTVIDQPHVLPVYTLGTGIPTEVDMNTVKRTNTGSNPVVVSVQGQTYQVVKSSEGASQHSGANNQPIILQASSDKAKGVNPKRYALD